MALIGEIETPVDDGTILDGDIASPNDVNLPAEAKPVSKVDPATQYTILKGWVLDDLDFSREWRKSATEAFAFRAGDQWTDEDRAMLNDQHRPVITFNRVLTILKAVAGMEINGRHEVQYLPRGSEDTAMNEVLSAASKWMGDNCDGEDEESQAFDHCATVGMGFVENRMSYEDDPAGAYVEECFDPREAVWDRTAKKKNLSDARRMGRIRKMPLADAMALFPGKTKEQLDAVWAEGRELDMATKTLEERRRRDTDTTMAGYEYDDKYEVTLVHLQWIEREVYYLVADAATNSKVEMTEREYQTLESRMKILGMPPLTAARLRRKIYKQAFLGAELLRPVEDAPIKGPEPARGRFSWDCITGEYDAKRGTWFGLVKVMRDPQMWANKWMSQILHILNSSAKGGIIAELDAFDDQREAEETWAAVDSITWVANGALSGGKKPKIMPKQSQPMTDGYLGMMTFAISSIKDVTGINLELLGQQDQNQPGILEAMRKQAGMTVLATLFDSLRRFRKGVGRSRLYFIQTFLSDERIIRVAGDETVEAVRLSKDKTSGAYDVIVDDTPTSPNQKEANWAIIQPMLAIFKDELRQNPEVLAMLLEYSPLPSRIVGAIKGFIQRAANDPTAQQEAKVQKDLMLAGMIAAIEKDKSVANVNNAKAGNAQTSALYEISMAQNMLADNKREELTAHLKAMETSARARAEEAKAQAAEARVGSERVKAARIMHDAETDRQRADTEDRKATANTFIERLGALGKHERDTAAAEKDRVIAAKEARTPIANPNFSRQ